MDFTVKGIERETWAFWIGVDLAGRITQLLPEEPSCYATALKNIALQQTATHIVIVVPVFIQNRKRRSLDVLTSHLVRQPASQKSRIFGALNS
jgi:hypothetical protein